MNTGFVLVWRSLDDHPAFVNDDERYKWIRLINRAAFDDHVVRFAGLDYPVKRGQLVLSVRQLASEWGWARSTTHDFLKRLARQSMIVIEAGHVPGHPNRTPPSLVTICNYEEYQRRGVTGRTPRPYTSPPPSKKEEKQEVEILLSTHAGVPPEVGEKGPSVSLMKVNGHHPKAEAIDLRSDFELLWKFWPRHEQRRAAIRSWNRLVRSGIEPDTIFNQAEDYIDGAKPAYVSYLGNFLDRNDFPTKESKP